MKNAALIGLAVILLWVGLHGVLRRPTRDLIIVAHRGAAGLAPENTLPAIRAGIESGADLIEIDVQRSRDGVLLLHHDAKIPGFRPLTDLDYATIREVGVDGEPIPTLDEALALFVIAATPDQRLLIEGKLPHRYPGIAAEIVAAVDAHDLRSRVLLKSFDQAWLHEVHALAPDTAIGSIHFYPFSVPHIDGMESVGLFWGCAVLDPTLIPRLHRRGLDATVWAIDSPALAALMRWLGADAIATDRPDRFSSR